MFQCSPPSFPTGRAITTHVSYHTPSVRSDDLQFDNKKNNEEDEEAAHQKQQQDRENASLSANKIFKKSLQDMADAPPDGTFHIMKGETIEREREENK
jgi:hypothetical protein